MSKTDTEETTRKRGGRPPKYPDKGAMVSMTCRVPEDYKTRIAQIGNEKAEDDDGGLGVGVRALVEFWEENHE